MRLKLKATRYPGWANLAILSVVAASLSPLATAQDQNSLPTTRAKVIHSFPLSKFYDTPAELPLGKPGELIRFARFDEYHLPGEVSAVRILYHSRSANNEDVAVSGVVLFPDKKPPE